MQRCPIMNVLRSSSLLLCLLFGCAASTQPSETPAADAPPSDHASHEAGPVGTKLVRDVTESPEKYEIGEARSGGLGGYSIQLDGAPIWPPSGAGCEGLVACCSSLAAMAKPLALSCLLAIARDKTCSVAFSTAVAIATEQSYSLPASCAP
jgi:hypothetical protein